MIKDLVSKILTSMILKAQNVTADILGSAVDLQDDLALMIVANVGTSGDTLSGSLYHELYVVESDDNSTYTAVADADLSASVAGAQTGTFASIKLGGDNQVYKVGYKGNKRYIKVGDNCIGSVSTGMPLSITGLTSPQHLPADAAY